MNDIKLNSYLSTKKHQYELLDDKIELFWKMEELPSKHIFTDEQKLYLTHFSENVYQNEDGKSIVKLPFKVNCNQQLGNSFNSALRRFLSLEKRLLKDSELNVKYKCLC
uniref:Uncharacterized protein n=1 Tax=Sipha flava TaxID=143950 RepID=A0A2S2QW26_9HEMI